MSFDGNQLKNDFLISEYGVSGSSIIPENDQDLQINPIEDDRSRRNFNVSTIWSYLSRIWGFLKNNEKPIIEVLWRVFYFIASHLTTMATLFINSKKLENLPSRPFTEYFSFTYDILESIPYYLNYTEKNPDYLISPIEYITLPEDGNGDIYSYVYISDKIYYSIRNFSQGYLVINQEKEFYPFVESGSTEEYEYLIDNFGEDLIDGYGDPIPNPKHIPSSNASNIYRIKVKGDLRKVEDSVPVCYLTTGRSYKIPSFIIDIEYLKCYSNRSNGESTFIKNNDYLIYKDNIEFSRDYIADGIIHNHDLMYTENADIVNYNLIDLYGEFIDLYDPNWTYNNNEQMNQVFYNALKGMQEQYSIKSLQTALQSLYGLPSAPVNGEVVGMFESGGYIVDSVDSDDTSGDMIRLALKYNKRAGNISPLFQYNTRILYHEYKSGYVKHVDYENGIITVDGIDGDISAGDKIHVELVNNYNISKVYAENNITENPGFLVNSDNGSAMSLQYLIDIYHDMYDNNIRPEFIVFGFNESNNNINGLYHLQDIEYPVNDNYSQIKINIYQYNDEAALSENENTKIYNDHIILNSGDQLDNVNGNALLHVSWPTPKFILMYGEDKQYHKIHLDSTVDSVAEIGQKLKKGESVTRNVSLLTSNVFSNWTSFMNYLKYSLIHTNMCLNEVVYAIPGAIPGKFLPIKVFETR